MVTEKELIIGLIKDDKLLDAMNIIVERSKYLTRAAYKIALNLQADLVRHQNDLINHVAIDGDRSRIRDRMIDLTLEMYTKTDENGKINPFSEDLLIMDNYLPFINRFKFREIVKNTISYILKNNCAKLIFVDGDSKSGISYLENYLVHICKKYSLFNLVSIDITEYLDNPMPGKGAQLLHALIQSINIDVNLNEINEDKLKFARFTTKLYEKLLSDDLIHIFFIHDFHKIKEFLNEVNLHDFIHELSLKISKKFPKSVFIITGYDYENLRNWKIDIRPACGFYKIETITEEDIMACLSEIFTIYETQIIKTERKNVTKIEFIQSTLEALREQDGKYRIETVGESLADLIYSYKSI